MIHLSTRYKLNPSPRLTGRDLHIYLISIYLVRLVQPHKRANPFVDVTLLIQ